jgi:hypothetical protein
MILDADPDAVREHRRQKPKRPKRERKRITHSDHTQQ